MAKQTINKYKWEGWLSVSNLARKFDVSKRRIQQVIAALVHDGKCLISVLCYSTGLHTFSKPVYKLFGWYIRELEMKSNGKDV